MCQYIKIIQKNLFTHIFIYFGRKEKKSFTIKVIGLLSIIQKLFACNTDIQDIYSFASYTFPLECPDHPQLR